MPTAQDGAQRLNDGSESKSLESAGRSPIRSYVTVAILFSVNLLNYMDRFTIAGVLKEIQSFYSIGNTSAGLLQTVFICAYMVFAPVFGYLGDRYSRKWLMALGLFIWSGSVLASTFIPADYFPYFMACRGLVGIGEASYATVSPTIIADLFDSDHRSRMLMIFFFAIPVGSGLGFIIGSNVAKAAGDWRWGVRLTPVLGAIAMLLIVVVLKEPRRGAADTPQSQSGLSPVNFRQDINALINNSCYLLVTLGSTAVAFVAGSMSWWTPNYVINALKYSGEIRQHDAAEVNLVFGGITCISGFVGVGLGALLATFWRRRNPRADPLVCALGLLLSTPCTYAALILVDIQRETSYVLMFLGVTSLCFNWSVISDIILYVNVPWRRATATAFQMLVQHTLGDAISPYLIGAVSDALKTEPGSAENDYLRLQYAMYIPCFVLVLGAFFFLFASFYVVESRQKAHLESIEFGKEKESPSLVTRF